jgi:hypothetical protein
MDVIAGLVLGLIHSIVWLFAIFLAFVVIVSLLPRDNPLRDMLAAVTKRLGVTLAIGVVALPIEFVPIVDMIFDVAAPLGLAWYWVSLFTGGARGRDLVR